MLRSRVVPGPWTPRGVCTQTARMRGLRVAHQARAQGWPRDPIIEIDWQGHASRSSLARARLLQQQERMLDRHTAPSLVDMCGLHGVRCAHVDASASKMHAKPMERIAYCSTTHKDELRRDREYIVQARSTSCQATREPFTRTEQQLRCARHEDGGPGQCP